MKCGSETLTTFQRQLFKRNSKTTCSKIFHIIARERLVVKPCLSKIAFLYHLALAVFRYILTKLTKTVPFLNSESHGLEIFNSEYISLNSSLLPIF